MPKQPADWHAQDWILVIDALARSVGDDSNLDEDHCFDLVEGIALGQRLPASELVLQKDPEMHFRDRGLSR